MSPYAFVTVSFEAEHALLRLQARSMARFLSPAQVQEIVVIDNSARGLRAAARRALLEDYGPLAGRVRVLRPREVAVVPATLGWRTQQALKLLVAQHLAADRYVLLDAKNHLVAPLEPGFFEAPDGRLRAVFYGYEQHPLRGDLERVLTYLGVDPREHVGRFTATVTPFALETQIVRELIAGVEHTSGRTFAREFVDRELLEFFLYSGWIVARGRELEEVYEPGQPYSPLVWPRAADAAGVAEATAASDTGGSPVFAVHRRALSRLDTASTSDLARFWTRRGLFGSTEEATAFVLDFQRRYDRAMRVQRLRDAPYRVRRRLAGLRSRSTRS